METHMRPVPLQVDSNVMPKALIVGAGPEALAGIQAMLGTNRFRVDFLDKNDTPYVAIRQRHPDLVVLCFAPDDDEACQVLQMLQLDPATRRLPILTYVNGEAYAIISSQWPPRTTRGIPNASNCWERYTAR
jgi:response regulator RpfG family c-di-GMP phosphodiesterase